MTKKVALITGATSGIGKAIAIELARQDYCVIVNFATSDLAARNVVDTINNSGGVAYEFKADVSLESDISDLFKYIEKNFGRLDVLINNAGIYKPDFIEGHEVSTWDTIFNINLKGKFLCTKYAVNLLSQSSSPRIVNIASRAATKAMEESVAYCCAAAGIKMLTKVSALELSKYNIHVNSISPGLTKTPMTLAHDTEEDFEQYRMLNPSKRIGTPEDIANVVSFLISNRADYINGENINVSGGSILL